MRSSSPPCLLPLCPLPPPHTHPPGGSRASRGPRPQSSSQSSGHCPAWWSWPPQAWACPGGPPQGPTCRGCSACLWSSSEQAPVLCSVRAARVWIAWGETRACTRAGRSFLRGCNGSLGGSGARALPMVVEHGGSKRRRPPPRPWFGCLALHMGQTNSHPTTAHRSLRRGPIHGQGNPKAWQASQPSESGHLAIARQLTAHA